MNCHPCKYGNSEIIWVFQNGKAFSLLNDKNIIIKKADKNGNCVILDKVDYLSEVHRQLSTYHYKQIENFYFKDLRMRLNSYLINMHTKDGIDKKIIELPLRRK